MTQFHLNKTPCFDQNGGILTKQKQEKKKKKADDLLYGYCSSSPIFLLKKTARVATF
jgi:hypothetical protein